MILLSSVRTARIFMSTLAANVDMKIRAVLEILIESFQFFPHPYAAFLAIDIHRNDGRKVVFFCAKIPTNTVQFFDGKMRQLLRINFDNLRPTCNAGGRW